MISDHFTTALTVSRMAWDVDEESNDFSERTAAGTIYGHIQQANMQLAQHLGLAFTKTFSIWCALSSDVEEGDDLHDGTYVYHVKSKHDFGIGQNKHLELYCERELVASDESA